MTREIPKRTNLHTVQIDIAMFELLINNEKRSQF